MNRRLAPVPTARLRRGVPPSRVPAGTARSDREARLLLRALVPALLGWALLTVGCASQSARTPVMSFGDAGVAKLNRNQYVVYGDTEAKVCSVYVGLFPIPIWWVETRHDPDDPKGSRSVRVFAFTGPEERSRQIAVYNAIGKAWHADALLLPREHVEAVTAYPWYGRVCVTVRGKAVRVKEDEAGTDKKQF